MSFFKNLVKTLTMSHEERIEEQFLSEAVDLSDLEWRMKSLQSPQRQEFLANR